MAKITEEVEIDWVELLELIQSKYPQVNVENFAKKPFLEIVESGDHDRGNYERKLKGITFYIKRKTA